MKKLLFLALFSFLIIHSCKEKYKGPTIAEGKVVDAITGKVVANATVHLARQERDQWSAMGREYVEKQQAGPDGSFSFSFEGDGNYHYSLDVEAPHYYKSSDAASIRLGEKNLGMKVEIWPIGYIKFIIINSPPNDTLSRLKINVVENSIMNFSGDTALYGASNGGKDSKITWWTTKKGLTTTTRDTADVYLSPLDTVEYTIYY